MNCSDPELRYLRRTPTGAEYVTEITGQESDRRVRAAFRDLVVKIAPPGGRLFDFGAGPGIDARFFAERGFTVDAYDVDPRMREFFAAHCRDLIDSGRVALDRSTYREFLAPALEDRPGRADLVISNFAPLNLVDDLPPLFATFHALTAEGGKILASVLNPCFVGEIRSRMWWYSSVRLWRHGELFLPGPQAPYYRRLLSFFRSQSAPHFRLSRVFPGMPVAEYRSKRIDVQRLPSLAWLRSAGCRYLFLLFEKAGWP